MAESKNGILALPPELRVLIAFLDADERPTLICRFGTGENGEEEGGTKSDVRYRNAVLEQAEIGDIELDKVVRTLGVYHKMGKGKLEVDSDNRSWEAREVLGGWHAVVGRAIVQADSLSLHEVEETQGDVKVDVINGGRELVAIDDSTGKQKRLDWIQYPGPNLSTWQRLILDHNWEATSLGPIKQWPHQLRSIIVGMVTDSTPRIVYWGPERAFLCNEAFVPLFGIDHPECLGRPLHTVLDKDLLDTIGTYIESAYEGKTEVLDRQPLQLTRDGHLEETYWDSTLTSIIGPDGTCVGVTESFVESTRAVRGERRRVSIMALGKQIASAVTLTELWSNFLYGLQPAVQDVPYAIIYSAENDASGSTSESADSSSELPERTSCELEGTIGVMQPETLPQSFSLAEEQASDSCTLAHAITQAWKEKTSLDLSAGDGTLPSFLAMANPDRGLGDKVQRAIAIPVASITGNTLVGVLVVGLCPRCPFDEEYRLWVSILGDVLRKTAALISLPIEQRRAQKMAEDINSALAQQLRITTLQAERSDAKFSRMAKLAPIGMFVLDPEGRPLYLNDAYRNLIPADKCIGDLTKLDDWQVLIHPDDLPRLKETWDQLTEEKIPNVVEYRILNDWRPVDQATGEHINGDTWILATSFPEIEPDGRISAVMGWITDISKQKAAEGLLAQRLEEALETKRQSERFIDMTSHELRNPLSAILQSADSIISTLQSVGLPILNEDMVLPGQHAEDIVDSAQIIILCAQHQKRITDDILTLSKLDASLLVISPDKVQLPELVEKALRMYEGEIKRADIKTSIVVEETYEELKVDWIVLDPSRLLQVIINLLTNSVKFTQYSDKREVTIHLGASYQRPTGKHHGVQFIPTRHGKLSIAPSTDWGKGEELYIQVAVSDTGKGLSAEEITVLFQRFAQASPKTYKQYGGSGLGLFISRELCELQGGQVGVSSNGEKTTFTFYVKARRWVPETHLARPALSRYVSAASSPMVFRRRSSAPIGQSNGSTTPQAVETSDSQDLDGALEDFGGNDHLSPAKKKEKPDSPLDEQLHVLVVEDNLINQKVMSQQLRRAGLIVHVANHGVECLDFVARSSFCPLKQETEDASAVAQTPLTIVLLDLEMPTMDGLTCIRHIRERQVKGEIMKHLPVIAVTANARSEQINSAIESGMDSVVTKPFTIKELLPQMRSLIAEVRARHPT